MFGKLYLFACVPITNSRNRQNQKQYSERSEIMTITKQRAPNIFFHMSRKVISLGLTEVEVVVVIRDLRHSGI